jgi:uncharacterized protein YndB with AHSA1/START domain
MTLARHEEFGPTGAVVIQGEEATLVFRRRLPHSPEKVWKALTDPVELSTWYMTKASIDGRQGGSIDLQAGPSLLHVTGRILTWDPPKIFEHEWKVAPRSELQSGEDAVIRWELSRDGDGTILHLEHRKLHRETALGFAPGTHAFLDRLKAHLDRQPLPNWHKRYQEVAPGYPPSWVTRNGFRPRADSES